MTTGKRTAAAVTGTAGAGGAGRPAAVEDGTAARRARYAERGTGPAAAPAEADADGTGREVPAVLTGLDGAEESRLGRAGYAGQGHTGDPRAGRAGEARPGPAEEARPDRRGGPEPVISLSGATATLGSRPVLRGVDLTVRRGEIVALLGANGSGKSTAVRAVVGQVPLTGGRLELFGTARDRFRDWARVGYVPQRTTAASGVPATVREVVSAGRLARTRLGLLRKADRAAVERALETVGMGDRAKDPVDALSGGQHQRVLIARALAGEPELLIMDEPMAGVDLAGQEVLAGTLREQVAAGATVLLVLHELGPLEPLIDRAVVLRDGCVVHDGPPPKAVGQHALPGHDHVHPHADEAAVPIRTGLLT